MKNNLTAHLLRDVKTFLYEKKHQVILITDESIFFRIKCITGKTKTKAI